MSRAKYSVSIIGHGNVGSHLAKAFFKAGVTVKTVVGRRRKPPEFTKKIKTDYRTNYNHLGHSDFIIIAVPDDSIVEVSKNLEGRTREDTIVLHVSGSSGLDMLDCHLNHGSMWPVQSIRLNEAVEWIDVPIVVSANSDVVSMKIKDLCGLITDSVHIMSSDQKSAIHPAAVFVNNFPTWLMGLAYEYCSRESLSFEVLLPLIRETTNGITADVDPMKMMTGPARRNDETTIKRHLDQLSEYKLHSDIYRNLTKSIQAYFTNRQNEKEHEDR